MPAQARGRRAFQGENTTTIDRFEQRRRLLQWLSASPNGVLEDTFMQETDRWRYSTKNRSEIPGERGV